MGSEEDRLTQIYRLYGSVIYARCRKLLNNDASAEDAAQETFVRVYRHLAKAPDPQEALAWIYRIATNYCLNELRHLRIASTVEIDDEPGRPSACSPEDQIADRQMVRKVFAPLPGKLRHVAVLRHVDGLLDAEIAATLGVSRRTVVSRLLAFRQRAAAGALRVAAPPA